MVLPFFVAAQKWSHPWRGIAAAPAGCHEARVTEAGLYMLSGEEICIGWGEPGPGPGSEHEY